MNQSKPTPTMLDRVIGYFSPKTQLKRVYARNLLLRKYEGASTTRRMTGWSTNNASSVAETFRSLDKLRSRSRDLIQNNPHAKRALDSVVNNVVGKGIYAQITDEKSDLRAEKINSVFKNWATSTDCDHDGTKNFFMLQRLVMKSVWENGEALILRQYPKKNSYKYAPLKLQVIEPDHLDTNSYSAKPIDGNTVVQGIEFDKQGQRVAYHILKEHPGGLVISRETIRIPASEVLHVYDELRAGQVRGIPFLAPVIVKLKDYDEYEDAQLVRQKVAACFAGFIVDMEMPESETDEEEQVAERIEPGTMEVLPPGKDVRFPNTPAVDGISEFSKISLRAIASALGISYESLSMDYSNVNFSSGRMGWIEMHRTIEDFRTNVLMPKFLDAAFMWFLESIALLGEKTDTINWSWTPPKREMIDPVKEFGAMVIAMKAGLLTYSGALQSMGIDPEDHLKQMANDLKLFDKYGLKLTSDPRQGLSTKQP